jgi:hypothetical protein
MIWPKAVHRILDMELKAQREKYESKLKVAKNLAQLVIDNMERNNKGGKFLGDDEHEIWTLAIDFLASLGKTNDT